MRCHICKSENVQLTYKRGKGKVHVPRAIIGGVLTMGIGCLGAAIGFTDHMTQKGYIHCPACGYDQFGNFNAKNILDPKQMILAAAFYDDYGIPMRSIMRDLEERAKTEKIPFSIRFAEIKQNNPTGPATLPCMLIENPDHGKYYFSICIAPGKGASSGDDGYFVFWNGRSVQIEKASYDQDASNVHGGGWLTAAGASLIGGYRGALLATGGIAFEIAYSLTIGFQKLFNSITLDRASLAEELQWYEDVKEIVDYVMGT